MERLYRALHPSGFELVAVSVDEDPSDVAAFRERVQTMYLDSEYAETWPEGLLEKINALGN